MTTTKRQGGRLRLRKSGVFRRTVPFTALAALSFGVAVLAFPPAEQTTPAAATTIQVEASAFRDVGRPTCREGDSVETGLQGQVPVLDRLTGRAARGYNCNLTEIGRWGSRASDITHSKLSGWANFDTYRNCASSTTATTGWVGAVAQSFSTCRIRRGRGVPPISRPRR